MNRNKELSLIGKVWTVVFIILTSLSLYSQKTELNGIGVFISLEHNRYGFTGTHVMNQAFEDSRGATISMGIGKEDIIEVGLSLGIMSNKLVDTRLVSRADSFKPFFKGYVKVPILESGRFAFLVPEAGFGRIRNDLQGEIKGDFFEVGNNFRYEFSKFIKLYIRVVYQRTGYHVTASRSVLPLFEVSHAIIPTIGIQISRFSNL